MSELFNFLLSNYQSIFSILLALVGVAEIVVRLTPSKEDDGAVERVGKLIRQFMDLLRIPNVKKK